MLDLVRHNAINTVQCRCDADAMMAAYLGDFSAVPDCGRPRMPRLRSRIADRGENCEQTSQPTDDKVDEHKYPRNK